MADVSKINNLLAFPYLSLIDTLCLCEYIGADWTWAAQKWWNVDTGSLEAVTISNGIQLSRYWHLIVLGTLSFAWPHKRERE